MQNLLWIRVIRNGLVGIIPILLIGSFSLVAKSIPNETFHSFITTFASGIVYDVINFVYDATFGMLSVYMAVSIGVVFRREKDCNPDYTYGAPVISLACYGMMTGAVGEGFDVKYLGVKGMFTAIFASVIALQLYFAFNRIFRTKTKLYAEKTDVAFNRSVSIIFPTVVIIGIFACFNALICWIFKVESFNELFINGATMLFEDMGDSVGSGLLFVVVSTLLWFFGVHGSDVLEVVTERIFYSASQENIAAVAAGLEPANIFTKQFFDLFVLIGGCGTTICLLIATLLFSRRKSNRNLARLSFLPMIFNINEIMVFGFPIVFNPIMILPFLLTPIVCFCTSYAAMYIGLVPVVSAQVEWVTPVFFSGYMATGSVAGSLLQLVNICLGIAVYCPFVKLYDRYKEKIAGIEYEKLVDAIRQSEIDRNTADLSDDNSAYFSLAQTLMSDLKYALDKGKLKVLYQPQFNGEGSCVGVEALLRWNHPVYEMVYPPLIIQLAREAGELYKLEKFVIERAAGDMAFIKKIIGDSVKISINITGDTVQLPEFEGYLLSLSRRDGVDAAEICFEITEQTVICFDKPAQQMFRRIREMGYSLAIDDFSMGYTSMQYLQSNYFNIVKLDGSLVTGVVNNSRCRNIIESIIQLSHSLKFAVVAEFVETETQKEILSGVGCNIYQGYYYSPAVEKEELSGLMNAGVKNRSADS